MNNLKIHTRLGVGFGAMLLLVVMIVAVAFARLDKSVQETDVSADYRLRAELVSHWYAKSQLNADRTIAIAKSGGQAGLMAHTLPLIEQTRSEISALQKTLQAKITSAEGKALFATVAEKRVAYISARDKLLATVRLGDQAATEVSLASAMRPASESYLASMAALQKYQIDAAQAHQTAVRSSLELAEWLLIGLMVTSLAIGITMAVAITRSITAPLNEAVATARVMAELDLSRPVESTRQDELGDLLRAFASLQGALRKIVGQVRHASDSIATASVEIATGNLDLSTRTEQTASNLQQAASSMAQLTGTVRQSADAARTANQLAASAASVAARGGEVVSQVVTTMDDINTSSKKIADIIGVIDGIAFQTNILALNAAVEAARAGEQGRGFAVVASEVRSLAQRSADAAKEIKGLIGASVDRVESGSKLVADAGSTMSEIVASVQRVSDIIGEISAASSEQSDGLGQVNGSVTQLDQMTQQNAALVEQSAAAAESLKDQASSLAGLMATFRTDASASARDGR